MIITIFVLSRSLKIQYQYLGSFSSMQLRSLPSSRHADPSKLSSVANGLGYPTREQSHPICWRTLSQQSHSLSFCPRNDSGGLHPTNTAHKLPLQEPRFLLQQNLFKVGKPPQVTPQPGSIRNNKCNIVSNFSQWWIHLPPTKFSSCDFPVKTRFVSQTQNHATSLWLPSNVLGPSSLSMCLPMPRRRTSNLTRGQHVGLTDQPDGLLSRTAVHARRERSSVRATRLQITRTHVHHAHWQFKVELDISSLLWGAGEARRCCCHFCRKTQWKNNFKVEKSQKSLRFFCWNVVFQARLGSGSHLTKEIFMLYLSRENTLENGSMSSNSLRPNESRDTLVGA